MISSSSVAADGERECHAFLFDHIANAIDG